MTGRGSHLREALESIDREIEAALGRIDAEKAYVAHLRRTAEELRVANQHIGGETSSEGETQREFDEPELGRPRTAALVRELLASEPHNHMRVPYIVNRLEADGALSHLKQPYNTVLEAAKRLAERDPFIYRIDDDVRGTFFVYSEHEPELGPGGQLLPFGSLTRSVDRK